MTSIEKALINYARLKNEIKELNKQISENITISIDNQPNHAKEFGKSYWLEMAYKYKREYEGDSCSYECIYQNHDGDVDGYLAENCEFAFNAHLLIKKRKPLKKQLGIAKAVISRMATRLLEQEIKEF